MAFTAVMDEHTGFTEAAEVERSVLKVTHPTPCASRCPLFHSVDFLEESFRNESL